MEEIMKMRLPRLLIAGVVVLFLIASTQAQAITLYAAGSLKSALGDVAKVYAEKYQTEVKTTFGPSGLLRKAIEGGENPDVFASANMAHPMTLAKQNWGQPVALFARNKLCAVAQQEVAVTTENLLPTMLQDGIRLGTSTPKADPSGDYAWELFHKADAVIPGAYDSLSVKALQLTGGPDSPNPPEGRNKYGWVMGEKQADIFLTYCTNAVLAQKEVTGLQIVKVPAELAVGADYGLLVRSDASTEAWRLAMFILSPEGQGILARYGFEASAIPQQ